MKLSEKSKERFRSLKSRVFYNPISRYSLLNSLKFNLAALVVFTSPDNNAGNIVIAVLTFIALNAVPVIFCILL